MKRNGQPPDEDVPYEEVYFSFEYFEWDETKRESNIERHEIDFRNLAPFFGVSLLGRRSDRRGEVRWLAVGFFEGRMISVVFTQRTESCRIISARRAWRKESAYRQLYKGRA